MVGFQLKLGAVGIATSTDVIGKAHFNVRSSERSPAFFIDVLKTLGTTFANSADAGLLDESGWPTAAPSGTISLTGPTVIWPGVQYKLAWPATRTFTVKFSGTYTLVSSSNATTSGGAANNLTVTTQGTAGYVILTTPGSGFTIEFPTTGTYAAGSGDVGLYRVSDEAGYLAGEYFTPEFITSVSALRPKSIRPMEWTLPGTGNETRWAYRAKPEYRSWASRIPPGAWGGLGAGTDTYTGSNAPDSPVALTEGELWIGYFPNTNTSTTPTFNRGGTGAKTIVTMNATACSVGTISANTIGCLIYDSILDQWLYSSGKLWSGVPIEAQVQLANRVGCDFWWTIPAHVNDDFVTQGATLIRDSLDNDLYPEYTNEDWNFSFSQTGWSNARGLAFGWSAGNNQALYGWYSLRVRQIMGDLIPAVFSSQMSRLHRVMAYQAAGDTTNINNRFKGVQLTPGNAAYNAFTGSANYSAIPDRPIDVCEVLSIAPYAGGSQLCYGPDNAAAYTPTVANNQTALQAIVDAWDGGNSAAAVALVDADVRQGRVGVQTVTGSGTTWTTESSPGVPVAHGLSVGNRVWFDVTGGTIYSGISQYKMYYVGSVPTSTTFTVQAFVGNAASGSTINAGSAGSGTVTVGRTFVTLIDVTRYYLFAESNAALFVGDRPVGMANLAIECYEGSLEPQGPSSAQCTAISLTGSNPAASITAAIEAWRNDTTSRTTQLAYFNQFMGTDSGNPNTFGLMTYAVAPCQFGYAGPVVSGSPWALLSGALPNSTPYQMYYGFQAFSTA